MMLPLSFAGGGDNGDAKVAKHTLDTGVAVVNGYAEYWLNYG